MKNFWKILKSKKYNSIPSKKLVASKPKIIQLEEQETMATLVSKQKDYLVFEFECEGIKRTFAFRTKTFIDRMQEGDQIKIRYSREIWEETNKLYSFDIHLAKGE